MPGDNPVTNAQLSREIAALRLELVGSADGEKVTLAEIKRDILYLGEKMDSVCERVTEHGKQIDDLENAQAEAKGRQGVLSIIQAAFTALASAGVLTYEMLRRP